MTVHLEGPPPGLPEFDREALERRTDAVLRELGMPAAELSLSLVDDDRSAELNREWRGREGPTDVLSFSLVEGAHAEHRGRLLGDIVIAVGVAARQAPEWNNDLDDELLRLVIHGVLHLLGHDHEEADAAAEMQARERDLWSAVRT